MKCLWQSLLDISGAIVFYILAVLGLCASVVFITAVSMVMGWV